ncbi:MAG TPA: hypothetical protein VEQ63_07740 [Bryobacteraceae bacterium]|nr:hypothetical protein [Bryobacteraceae bacterium]
MTRIKTIVGVLLTSAVLAAAPASAANAMVERSKLEKMAETAKTPKDHVEVSKQYRLQAAEFEQKAAKHESEARRLQSASGNPMAQKWPGMVNQTSAKQRQLAMEARRAAKECLEASDRHMRMSVERLAEATDTQSTRANNVD